MDGMGSRVVLIPDFIECRALPYRFDRAADRPEEATAGETSRGGYDGADSRRARSRNSGDNREGRS